MSVKVIITPRFNREAKRLIKKFRSLRKELKDLENKLLENRKS